MADKENRASGRYSTFSMFALDILKEFYHINGFPTKSERTKICDIIGETEKRVQNWFKGQRKVDRRRDREVAKGDTSEFLVELEKTQSVFQLCKTSQKRKRDLEEAELQGNGTSNEGPPHTVLETLRVLKEEPRLTPSLWPHPSLAFSVPTFDPVPYGFPALTSALPMSMTASKTPKKDVSFIPTLTESSSIKNSLRIKNPFEEDPTPTKKRRKLSNDVTRFVHSVDTVMEDILNGTSPLLPHIDSFLWGTDGPRFM